MSSGGASGGGAQGGSSSGRESKGDRVDKGADGKGSGRRRGPLKGKETSKPNDAERKEKQATPAEKDTGKMKEKKTDKVAPVEEVKGQAAAATPAPKVNGSAAPAAPVETEEERRKKEEQEQKKQEEDAAAAAAAEAQQALELELQSQARVQAKRMLREENLNAAANPPDPSTLKNLDSNLQKATRFKNKIKSLSETVRAGIVSDFQSLNLSKFVEEVVDIIVNEETDAATIQKRVTTFRSTLRLWGELIVYGVLKTSDDLLTVVQEVCLLDKDHVYTSVIIAFCRYCNEDLLGIMPRKQRMLLEKYKIEVPCLKVLPDTQVKEFRDVINNYYTTLAQHLVREHKLMLDTEERNHHIMQTKGDLNQERKDKYEELLKQHEKLTTATSTLADLLDRDLPDLPVREIKTQEVGISVGNSILDGDGEGGIWEDDEARSFYENLVQLRAFVPAVLFGDSAAESAESKEEEKEEDPVEEVQYDEEGNIVIKDAEDGDAKKAGTEESASDASSGAAGTSATDKATLDLILTRLSNAANREIVDNLATEFCYVNSKRARTRLVNALFACPKARLDLLPYYSRLVATLGQCIPDIGTRLLEKLEAEFYGQVKHSVSANIEWRIRNIRYLAELTKFGVCPKNTALNCLQKLITDFTPQSIMVACAFLEICGRFIYRSPDSHVRCKNVLEVMVRKKNALHLDPRLATAIENAFYYCNPPERTERKRKERPPLHMYIRKLLFKDLSKTTTEKVLKQMKKLPWDDPSLKAYMVKCLSKPWKCKYNNIYCLASLVAGIDHYYGDVGVKVVDAVLEDVRLGMEINLLEWNQRRISVIKYFGELYNYRLFEGALLFETLYSLIFFSHDLSHEGPSFSALDQLDDYFRIRLVCTLLESCGQYFDHGSSKKKMDCFLIFFQRYILGKKQPLPLDIDFMIQDTFEMVRPQMTMHATYMDAQAAVLKLQQELQQKMLKDTQGGQAAEGGAGSDDESEEEDGREGSDGGDSEGDDETREARRGHSDEASGESGDDGDGEGHMGGDDDFDDVHLKDPRKKEQTEEDAAFLEEFSKFMGDQLQGRKNEKVSSGVFDAPIPMQLMTKESSRAGTGLEPKEGTNAVMFTLMTKKGNKPQLKEVAVPLDSALAINVRQKKVEEAAEHRELKRLVLEYEERDIEGADTQDHTGIMAALQRGPAPSTHPHARAGGPPPPRMSQKQRKVQGQPGVLRLGPSSYEGESKRPR
eukprot:comp23320_c0_seq2/m.38380 comp23320_c0_seq2/g.38380  ORF comp23320_c0_seq2/g.38380 comp23320_c0_seq2/m.38380 type:complete len:1223 (-) comp23320_c0_seq2:468-4136(-)